MERWCGKVAVITGASGPLGLCLCQFLAENGLKVIGLARRIDRIEDAARKLNNGGKLWGVKCDVSREEEILRAFKWIRDNVGVPQILINNAGLARTTNLTDGSTDVWRKTIDVNVIGLCLCTRETIKPLRERDLCGHIIHINAICGFNSAVEFATNIYPASKCAVATLADTLRQELRHLSCKIKVTTLSPGAVKNNFKESIDESLEEIENILKPEDVADVVLYVLSTPPHVQIEELVVKSLRDTS